MLLQTCKNVMCPSEEKKMVVNNCWKNQHLCSTEYIFFISSVEHRCWFFQQLFTTIFFSSESHIKLIKSDSKYIYNVKEDLFRINAVVLNFKFIKKFWNKFLSIKQHNYFRHW